MKNFILIIILILIIAGLAYAYNASKAVPDYGTDAAGTVPTTVDEVKVGQTNKINDLDITLNEVVQDSRCPIDAQCIEAGGITANVTWRSGNSSETRNIASDEVPVSFGSFRISIIDVKPPRYSGSEPDKADYVATFRVDKQ